MRQTNKYMRGGTAIIIAAGLGLSSTALSSDANTPVKEVVNTVLDKVELPALPELEIAPKPLPELETQTAPIAPKKIAEAPEPRAETQKPRNTSSFYASKDDPKVIASLFLAPKTLDAAIEKEMNRRRFAVAAGEMPKTAISEWPGMRSNHVSVSLTTDGVHDAKIYNVDGVELPLETQNEKLASLKLTMDNCIAHGQSITSADYFEYTDPISSLVYNVTCKPNHNPTRNIDLSVDEEIALLMADTDVDIKTRKARARGMKAGSLIREYKTKFPNPTREQNYEECLSSMTLLNEGYRYHNSRKQTEAEIVKFCDDIDVRDFGPKSE
ncbi:hypothetical protein N9W89_06920 [Hellea sp.]|nr:hypothetical protein [Hellea sp.]